MRRWLCILSAIYCGEAISLGSELFGKRDVAGASMAWAAAVVLCVVSYLLFDAAHSRKWEP